MGPVLAPASTSSNTIQSSRTNASPAQDRPYQDSAYSVECVLIPTGIARDPRVERDPADRVTSQPRGNLPG